jgi:hypothetical protein
MVTFASIASEEFKSCREASITTSTKFHGDIRHGALRALSLWDVFGYDVVHGKGPLLFITSWDVHSIARTNIFLVSPLYYKISLNTTLGGTK